MKNRIFATVAVLCLLLSLCACKKKGDSAEPVSETVSETPTEATTKSPILPESAPVPASYFDDAVFIGDSISEGLHNYADDKQSFGDAVFLTSVSLSATNALWDVSSRSVHPRYEGEKRKIEDVVPLTGASKVYLMLGMNDIIAVGVDKAAINFEKLCDRILENAPEVQLFVQSVTPLAGEGETSGEHELNNETISAYNEQLKELCAKRGWYYLDVASALSDETGRLDRSICSDPSGMGMHLTFAGCAKWVEFLYTHAI